MKYLLEHTALAIASVAFFAIADTTTGECAPYTWTWESERRAAHMVTYLRASATPYPRKPSDTKPGELNCRSTGRTYDEASSWSCEQIANAYSISIERFFELNPELSPNCDGIQPNTEYCVRGFIEPVRSQDGLCGPNHNNATCIGTLFGQCCNAETWKCGETKEDCAAGTCWEGLCHGHKIYTTDGNCGYEHNFSRCAGKWGDCCSIATGKCGTGEDFCGKGKCQSGNCTEGTNSTPI
ncbi:hypothetical protein F5B22DRAFT_594695 [Xylaria bambusicola]|uniref:uncharacterized protein n=1 Tax=Xylaria bambusicola TaxID=326684 RepID=UPI0020079553|nr:uncharacterized protein F5B22DRAFT_594695 [Xylaria bambusicola]KAI0521918.1 hypothetical protein F5B22DRAFT_594695 [Xylaria bambusicola]